MMEALRLPLTTGPAPERSGLAQGPLVNLPALRPPPPFPAAPLLASAVPTHPAPAHLFAPSPPSPCPPANSYPPSRPDRGGASWPSSERPSWTSSSSPAQPTALPQTQSPPAGLVPSSLMYKVLYCLTPHAAFLCVSSPKSGSPIKILQVLVFARAEARSGIRWETVHRC